MADNAARTPRVCPDCGERYADVAVPVCEECSRVDFELPPCIGAAYRDALRDQFARVFYPDPAE